MDRSRGGRVQRLFACAAAVAAVAVGAAVAIVPSAAASPLTRSLAGAVALKALGTQSLAGMVTLFGLPAPLPAGDTVGAWSLTSGHGVMPGVRLAKPAWLFWEDLVYGASLAHPSQLLLVDAASGRVLAHFDLTMMPLVNGAEPPFAPGQPGYTSQRYVVYSTLAATGGAAGASSGVPLRPQARAQAAQATKANPITKADLKGQCLITIGDRGPDAPANNRGDASFAKDFAAMDAWAGSVGLSHRDAPSSAGGLEATVFQEVRAGCKDVLLYIAGHGREPPPSAIGAVPIHYGPFKPPTGRYPATGTPGVQITADLPAGSAANAAPTSTFLMPSDIANLITDFSETASGQPREITIDGKTRQVPSKEVKDLKFKVKLQTCYAGWFADVLFKTLDVTPGSGDHSHLALVETSSGAAELSFFHQAQVNAMMNGKLVRLDNPTTNSKQISEATNANIAGLTAWAMNPTAGKTLEAGITQAFSANAQTSQDWTRRLGWTHPQVLGPGFATLGTPDPATPDTYEGKPYITTTDDIGGQGVTSESTTTTARTTATQTSTAQTTTTQATTTQTTTSTQTTTATPQCATAGDIDYCATWVISYSTSGEEIGSILTISNNGPSNLTIVDFAFAPDAATVSGVFNDPGCSLTGGGFYCSDQGIELQYEQTVTFSTTMPLAAGATGTLTLYDNFGSPQPQQTITAQ